LLIQTDIQSGILVHLKAHLRVEKALGKEITPSMNKAKTSEKFLQAENCKFVAVYPSIENNVCMLIRMIVCKELDCLSSGTLGTDTKRQDILAW
jgi:hypothetical protein